MECVDLQTFHKHYCAMVITYNVANCFFGGVRVFFCFFLYFLGGWVSLSLGILSEVLSGRDFVGHFVRGGGVAGGFIRRGFCRFFLSGGFLTGRVCRGFLLTKFLSAGFVGGFCQRVLSGFFLSEGFL